MNSTHKRLMSLFSLVVALIFSACDSVDQNGVATDVGEAVADEMMVAKGFAPNGPVTVMTRNMYVGTDVDKVMMASSAEEVPILVAEAMGVLQQTDFGERAKAMAAEIRRYRPHVIGLQEVSRVRLQTPGDAAFGGTTPAEDPFIDFLPTLLAELSALGLSYEVAGEIENIDIELPMITNPTTFSFTDVRLTDSDVILARSDVVTEDVATQNYGASFEVFGALIQRGFVAVDATIKGKTYRIVNTHLEPVDTGGGIIQEYQAGELVATLASEDRPLILLGDFNSDAPDGSTYKLLSENGYNDAWLERRRRYQPGYTCCQDPGLMNNPSGLDRRIDHIFFKNFEALWVRSEGSHVQAYVVGDGNQDRTASGLWPSDHAGVVAQIYVPARSR